jgi:hypothetical protein
MTYVAISTSEIVERLAAIEDIKSLRARFARLLDTKDWEGFYTLWTDDATLEASVVDEAPQIYTGPQQIVSFVRDALKGAITVHHPTAPEIVVRNRDEAQAVWSMEDLLIWPEGHVPRSINGHGHYHETYRRVGDAWRVRSFRLTRLYIDVRP